ncbi:hypothetical protein CPS_3361 [Colwellia psychrerythraea 34H]|uniref:Uncharacterized protein n=1 Tax=Colwellia psychrerythraea (strain 34H / ATCC BAA-681) TaxID=167879 RepID=Q47YT3_COLP3|nr:hypothetical protein CPS_3361 [Colwellia psychrerythraea 34H]
MLYIKLLHQHYTRTEPSDASAYLLRLIRPLIT